VKIVELTGGSTTSTRQFIWDQDERSEARDGSGNVTNQFFRRGETVSGSGYYYTKDQLGSIREMTNSSGTIVWQQSFGPWGEPTTIVSVTPADFGYAGYYLHSRSGLNLAMRRTYSATLGRWLSRDPIGEPAVSSLALGATMPQTDSGVEPVKLAETLVGPNLYSFVGNNPISNFDPLGLCDCKDANPLPPSGPNSPCSNYGYSSFGNVSQMCVCRCMPDDPDSNRARGCLACHRSKGDDPGAAHNECVFPHPNLWPALIGCVARCSAMQPAF
jgi:RHS repeat-associated protein